MSIRSKFHALGRRQRNLVLAAAVIIIGSLLGSLLVYHPPASLDAITTYTNAIHTQQADVQDAKGAEAPGQQDDVHHQHVPAQDTPSAQFHPDSINANLDAIKLYKRFIKEDIFDPILADEYIDRCALLNNGAHYVGGKKKGHYNGPMKESYANDDVYTKERLLEYLTLNDEEFNYIKKSHEYILEKLPQQFPEKLLDMFGSKENKNGYVFVGGGKFNYLTLLALKALRDTGAVYPAEVLLPVASDFDVTLCNVVFPALNAKCIVIQDYLPKETEGRVTKYQIKSVALLLNSFQNVMLLDADNMAIKNPDYLFDSEPFTSQGLVLWPDMWRRSTSPLFYDIAGITVDETKRARNSYWHVVMDGKAEEHGYNDNWQRSFHDSEGAVQEASTESGQILVNKKTHLQTIFMSLYYNFHGPSYFYPLFTQNSHGEGDKETYIIAAHILKQPYYQVEEYAMDFHREHAKVRRGSQRIINAIGQFDPAAEYQLLGKERQDAWSAYEYSNHKSHWEYKIWKESELMFLHCNAPKLYAWSLIQTKGVKGFKKPNGDRQRLYEGLYGQLNGNDYELKLMGMLEWFWCEYPTPIKGLPEYDDVAICKEIRDQISWLKENVY